MHINLRMFYHRNPQGADIMYFVHIGVLFLIFHDVVCVCIENQDECSEDLRCGQKCGLTDNDVRCCALKDGVLQLLDKRDVNWSWGERVQAEGIIALHLGKFDVFPKRNAKIYISVKQMNIDLLSALSKDNDLSGIDWSRGKLAYYVLGLLATCQLPEDFYGHDSVTILNNNLVQQSSYLSSNKFAYALIVIALCKSGANVSDSVLDDISTTPGQYTFGVDEAAMVYMAYRCSSRASFIDKENAAIDFILGSQGDDGLFGNEYSTALALQAIFASKNASLSDRTKESITFLAKSIDRKNNSFTSLLLSVLPALAKKSLLDIGDVQCPPAPNTTVPTGPTISTSIRVTNSLTASDYDQSWIASLTQGQTLYDAMINLQGTGQGFSFTSKTSTFGQYITAINGMAASSDDRQYWSILDFEGKPLPQGVSQTIPSQGDSYQFNMTTW